MLMETNAKVAGCWALPMRMSNDRNQHVISQLVEMAQSSKGKWMAARSPTRCRTSYSHPNKLWRWIWSRHVTRGVE